MKEQEEMPAARKSASPGFRYWSEAPEMIAIPVADLVPLVPRSGWKRPPDQEGVIEIPASKAFSRNVPAVSMRVLAGLFPERFEPSDELVRLPAARLAVGYRLVEQREVLPVSPDPEFPEPAAKPLPEEAVGSSAAPEPPDPIVPSAEEVPEQIPPAQPAPETTHSAAAESEKGAKFFSRLPIFRRRPADVAPSEVPAPAAMEAPPIPEPPAVPAPEPPREEEVVEVPAAPPSEARETARPTTGATPPSLIENAPAPVVPPAPVETLPVLKTEAISDVVPPQEFPDQEPLQALFLTDEILGVDRVIELCGGLPGITSCVLAQGSAIVASHNVPERVDLVSMSAHAAEMLRTMRESSARMGVGPVPAVTLHTEKGVISFFHRDDLTLLVFHKDRGFTPGVREKMVAVLAELGKARLTLPAFFIP